MRMISGVAVSGAVFGVLAGVFAHFASYQAREGVFIVGDDAAGQLLVRPPWTELLAWGLAGLVVGVVVGVVLHLLGFRVVRTPRHPRDKEPIA